MDALFHTHISHKVGPKALRDIQDYFNRPHSTFFKKDGAIRLYAAVNGIKIAKSFENCDYLEPEFRDTMNELKFETMLSLELRYQIELSYEATGYFMRCSREKAHELIVKGLRELRHPRHYQRFQRCFFGINDLRKSVKDGQ